MEFKCQEEPLVQLEDLKSSDRHSVLIEGPAGCGKSYLAKRYADMLGVSDFVCVAPKVVDVKSAVDSCVMSTNRVVLAVENLDEGVHGASYALLKFLEEPTENVYIIVTCRNIRNIPDTIISRSTMVTVSPPSLSDISSYAASKDLSRYESVKGTAVWQHVRSFAEADEVLSMNIDQITYYANIVANCKLDESVSSIAWSLAHYTDNTDNVVEFAIRCLVEQLNDIRVRKCGIECLKDLSQRRIAKHAVLSKFAFNLKYFNE